MCDLYCFFIPCCSFHRFAALEDFSSSSPPPRPIPQHRPPHAQDPLPQPSSTNFQPHVSFAPGVAIVSHPSITFCFSFLLDATTTGLKLKISLHFADRRSLTCLSFSRLSSELIQHCNLVGGERFRCFFLSLIVLALLRHAYH